MTAKHLSHKPPPRRLAHIGLLALDGCYTSSLMGIVDCLQVANAHLRNRHRENNRQPQDDPIPQFSWEIISHNGDTITTSGGLAIAASHSMAAASHCDLIYIPALFYPGKREFDQWLESQGHILDWLNERWQAGSQLAANCTGTFLLAQTGLLNSRHATCTWWLEQQFRLRYPRVRLDVNQLLTQDERLICAGAMSSYLHLAIQLVEQYADSEIAASCAKALLIDTGQSVQAPYQSLSNRENSQDPLTARAQLWLKAQLHTQVKMPVLAREMNVSQRTLIRKFKAEFDCSPLAYLQNLRIETAKQLLEGSSLSLADIIEQVGYADASSFARLFQKRQGITPAMYRHRFKPKQRRNIGNEE